MTQRELNNYKCSLSTEHLEKAKQELNEDPETRKLEIQALRERLLRYPGLTPRVDDAFLIKFLRPGKYDQERTFQLLMNFYKMKKDNEDMYAEMTPKHVKNVLDAEIMSVIPHGGKMGEVVCIFKSERFDTDKIPIEDVFKTFFVLLSVITESEEAQVNGFRFIYDLKGFGLNHCRVMSPSMAQKIASLFQDSFPARVKGIHHVNEHSVFDIFYAIIRPFLKEKLVRRLFFHGNKFETLHKFIPAENLPVEYGGTQPTVCPKNFNKHILAKQAEFEEDAKFGFVSMTIKQKTNKSSDAMEDLPGTFRKLNVD